MKNSILVFCLLIFATSGFGQVGLVKDSTTGSVQKSLAVVAGYYY